MKGSVQEIFNKQWQEKVFWTMKVGGEKINTGTKRPPDVGTYIEFSTTENARGYKETKFWKVLPGEAPPVNASAATSFPIKISKDDYWERKETRDLEVQKRIEIQSCRNSAISFVQVLLQTQVPTKDGLEGIVPVPAKGPKRLEFVEALLAKYEAAFLAANSPAAALAGDPPKDHTSEAVDDATDASEAAWG